VSLPRVIPQSIGTFQLDAEHRYTIGREGCRLAVDMALREPWVAVDIETAGLGERGMDIKCVTIATAQHAVILDERDEVQGYAIEEALEAAKVLVFHNAAYDVPFLVRRGLMKMHQIAKIECTMVYARFATPGERVDKSLDGCSQRYLGTAKSEGLLSKAFKANGMTKTEGYRDYDLDRPIYVFGAAEDALTTAAIYLLVMRDCFHRLLDHPFKDRGLQTTDEVVGVLNREQTINRMLIRRASKGYLVDYEFLDRYREENQHVIDTDSATIASAGVLPKASSLVAYLEANDLFPFGYPRTPKGAYSTAGASLDLLDDPISRSYKRRKDLLKVDNDYLQKCVDLSSADGRIHPSTGILAAVTGRSSMGTPPIQQFPAQARGIVLAEPGDSLASIDWAQIEPVVVGNLAHEYDILDFYESGGDFYAAVAEAGGITRYYAKKALLAQLYGEGMTKLCADIKVDEKTGYAIKEAIFKPLPRVQGIIKRAMNIATVHECIFTLSGRIVPVDRDYAYKATNYLTQGSAYDLLAETLYGIHEAGLGDALYFGLHDEVVVSMDAAHDVRKIMETPPARLIEAAGRVPVLRTDMVEMGERWTKPE
jgi:DNA polymerase I-like protein with 3'-5' exonuclease and polymerase domains